MRALQLGADLGQLELVRAGVLVRALEVVRLAELAPRREVIITFDQKPGRSIGRLERQVQVLEDLVVAGARVAQLPVDLDLLVVLDLPEADVGVVGREAALRVRARARALVADAQAVVGERVVRVAAALVRVASQKKLLLHVHLRRLARALALRADLPPDALRDRRLVLRRLRYHERRDLRQLLVVQAVHRVFRRVRAGH